MVDFRLAMYQKKQIDIAKEEKLAHEKEMKIHEDKMHKLNLQVKQVEVIFLLLFFPIQFNFLSSRISITDVV